MMMSDQALKLLNYVVLLFPAFLFVFTFKGFFQAFVAKLMGDRTAYEDGFISLNPLVHVDIFGITATVTLIFFLGMFLGNTVPPGTLILLLIVFGIRWTFPPPIEPSNFKRLKLGGILTSLSGSIGLFLLAFIMLVLIRILSMTSLPLNVVISIRSLLGMTLDLSTWFGVLNLIPLPPFGGGKILYYVLPYSQQHIVEWLEHYSLYIFLGLILIPGVSDVFWGILYTMQLAVKTALINLVFF